MKFVAVWGKSGANHRILSVSADTRAEAEAEIINQLSRPGRWGLLTCWQMDGSQIIEVAPEPLKLRPDRPLDTAQDRARPRERWER